MVSTIASTTFATYHHCPPIMYDRGGGDIERYAVVRASTSSIGAYREETYEAGYSELDSASRPTLTNSILALATTVLGNEIHIVTQENASLRIGRSIFNMSSNTWTTADEQVFAGDTNATTSSVGIIAISSSNVIVVGQGTTRNNKGTRYNSTSYWQWTGASWGSEVEFDDAVAGVHYRHPDIVYDGSSKAHLIYDDVTNIQHKSLTISGLSLSSAEVVNDTPADQGNRALVHYTAGSTSRAVVSWRKNSNGIGMVSFIDSDGTPGAESAVTDVAVPTTSIALSLKMAADDTNDELYFIYTDSSSSDLWQDIYTGGAWGTDTELVDAITINAIGGASVFDDGGLTLGILYVNGTTTTILEVSISSGAQNINLGFINSSSALYDPDLEPTIALSTIASASVLYAFADINFSITLGFIASSSALYDLVMQSGIALNSIASTSLLYDPEVQATLALAFISSSSALYDPELQPTILLDAIASSSALYDLELQSTIALAFISSTTVAYALSAAAGGAAQDVNLDFIASSSALYDLELQATILLDAISSSSVLYALVLELTIALAKIDSSTQLYDPQLQPTIELSFIASTSLIYTLDASVNLNILLDAIASSTVLYDLELQPTIELAFISSASVVYALSASAGLDILLDAIASSSVLYDPQLQPTIVLGFIASSSVLYDPDLQPTIILGFIASGSVLYDPELQSSIALAAIVSSSALYDLELQPTLALEFISSSSALYDPELQATILLDAIASTSQLYALLGLQTIALDLIGSGSALYDPELQPTIELGTISSATLVYALVAQIGTDQNVNLDFIPSTTVLYALFLFRTVEGYIIIAIDDRYKASIRDDNYDIIAQNDAYQANKSDDAYMASVHKD